MSRIQQLSTSIINKIAAGEVIERPASVIKELLENSLDALATRIEVDVQAGGAELLRVVDDGEGIHPDDVLLAVTSHATSKIRAADDLFAVHTMGFRGEALASIAEVSRLRLRSRQAGSDFGSELLVDLGERGDVLPCGSPLGTQIEIRDLFANTPVRRKFLKTPSTEFGHISEQFARVALANPQIHFILRHNDRLVYDLPATNQLSDRLAAFFGAELTEKLIWVESQQGNVRMWGYVGHPSLSKPTRKMQFVFLNGRWIQDRSLQHALTEAYRGLMMVGRQPVSFLFIDLPAADVDVNVHPTKIEVRFLDSQKLYRQLLSMLRNQFLTSDLDSQLKLPGTPKDVSPETRSQVQAEFADWARQQLANTNSDGPAPVERDEQPWPVPYSTGSRPAQVAYGEPVPAIDPAAVVADFQETAVNIAADNPWQSSDVVPVSSSWASPASAGAWSLPSPAWSPSTTLDQLAARPRATSVEAPAAAPFAEPLKPKALQIHDCYLVVETDEGLTVIDQHALHERILYEQFRTRVLGDGVESQRLLVPFPIEVTGKEAATLVEHTEVIKQMGLYLSDFGQGTVLLEAYPVLLPKVDLPALVRDIAELLDQKNGQVSRRDLVDELLHMMACKAAIKAGQKLSENEIDSLLTQRHLVDDAHHCPHGRPTALKLSRHELDRQFGRLG